MTVEHSPGTQKNFGYARSVASIQAYLRRHRSSYVDLTNHLLEHEIEGWVRSTYDEVSQLSWFGELDVARVAFGKGGNHERVFCHAVNSQWRQPGNGLPAHPIFVCEVINRWSLRQSLCEFALHGLREYLLPGAPGYKLGARVAIAKLADADARK